MNTEYSLLILKEFVILPNQEVKIEIKSEISKKIINNSYENKDGKILVIAPINSKEISLNTDDLPKIGVISQIKNKIELANGNFRVTLKGSFRVVIDKYYNKRGENDILYATTLDIEIPKFNTKEETALIRKLKSSLKDYISLSNVSNSIINIVNKCTNIDLLTDIITSFLPFSTTKKLEYMQNINSIKRAHNLLLDIEEEIEIFKIEQNITDKLNEKFEKNNKEFILKEKIKEIQEELGTTSLKDEEVKRYYEELEKNHFKEEVYNKLKNEIEKYSLMNNDSPEMSVIRNYLETVLNMPWNKTSKEINDITKIKDYLEKTHFGLEEIKTRITEYIEIKNICKNENNPIICLVGPPGVGKTSIAMSIAKALNRKFIKISLGGLNDSTELVGSRRTYLGASPGKIIQGIKKCNTNNPIILLDEVDKLVNDYKGDPASTLLEILDPIQNKLFTDNYIEEPFDLSKTMFILTANNEEDIPYTLLDRLEIIKINSYSIFEKENIAINYLLPKIYEEYKYTPKIKFSNELVSIIINNYTKEFGVRNLDRELHKLIRKIIVNNPKFKTIDKDNVKTLLGEYKYEKINYENISESGVVNILSTSNGAGTLNKLEISKIKGNDRIITTGSLGDVLNESIKVALTYVAINYKIKLDGYDLHFHFLDATTKKEGPSAGVSIVTGLISLFLNKPVLEKVAFTGEISLKGNILPIGGLKEKLISAYNFGIEKVYIPYQNINELKELPEAISKKINIIPVKNYNEIYQDLFK